MSTPTIVRSMSESEWKEIGKEFYGEDVKKWEFICPNCKLVMSGEKFKDQKAQLKKSGGWSPYSECVGRYLKDQGCDWAAYGLFSGPREILKADGTHRAYVFYFAKEVVSDTGELEKKK